MFVVFGWKLWFNIILWLVKFIMNCGFIIICKCIRVIEFYWGLGIVND